MVESSIGKPVIDVMDYVIDNKIEIGRKNK